MFCAPRRARREMMGPAGPATDLALVEWRAESLGARVQRGGHGQVHSVFARAVNLVCERGRLLAVLAPGTPRVAHGLRLQGPHAQLSAWFAHGAAFRWEGTDLCIESRRGALVRVSTARAVPWCCGLFATGARADRLAQAVSNLCTLCLPVGWVEPIIRNEGGGTHRCEAGQCSDGFRFAPPILRGSHARAAEALQVRIAALATAYVDGDAAAIDQAVHALLGLGPGLTPAGDDALIGWLAGTALLPTDRRRDALCRAIRDHLHRTTDVSRAHLEDALAGEFSEPLARFANALLLSTAQALSALADLANVGASSGLDAAQGLLAAIETAARVETSHA